MDHQLLVILDTTAPKESLKDTPQRGEIGGGGGLTTAAHVANNAVVTLDLTAAQDHKVTTTGICTITCWWYRSNQSYD